MTDLEYAVFDFASLKSDRELMCASKGLYSLANEVFDFLVRKRHLPENPLKYVDPPKSRRVVEVQELTADDVYTPQEANKLLSVYPGFRRAIVEFLFFTGMRHGECAALEWGDWDGGYGLRIDKTLDNYENTTSPKTHRGRTIRLTERARGVLMAQRELYPNAGKGEQIWRDAKGLGFTRTRYLIYDDKWKRACKAAGVKQLVAYTTRHSFAIWALDAGEAEVRIAQHLGHTSLAQLRKTYAKWLKRDEVDWSFG